ncbi:hypothetical protein VP01_1058g7 [Puccinia sorghi]|uniref:Alkaline phytoceramidase n=1 Tax=Puccinia sorghi TaxID=27349 RepID=A0A0L6VTY9_9BASI|nr:hypothetical protein VP01_1058g7 [Puccinia sorghi]
MIPSWPESTPPGHWTGHYTAEYGLTGVSNGYPPVQGYWGPSTASIDWCEANYAITRFIAEFTNTLSNLVFVGIALVGVGSFLFHATLRYEWQLGDELPMIFCCAFITYVAFDTGSASLPRTRFVSYLPYILVIYSLGVSAIYLRYPNPVFHQVAYALIQTVATFRSAYTVRAAPEGTFREQKNKSDAIRYLLIGSVTFMTGFLIWNVDNLFCDRISHLKEYLGTPLSFILEGHAWWHLATGTGSYLIVVGLQLMSLSLKEGADGFEIRRAGPFGLCPYVARISIKIDPKLH